MHQSQMKETMRDLIASEKDIDKYKLKVEMLKNSLAG